MAILLAGCSSTGPPPPPDTRPPTPAPASTTCDPSVLRAEMGTGTPDFSTCDVPVVVTIPGADVRQAKAQCHAFERLESDWRQRMENWDRLLASIMERTAIADGQPSPVREAATVVRNTAAPMRDSASVRRQRLVKLLENVNKLEEAAGVPSPPEPDCQ